jgi:hypothetical protein
MTQMLKHLLHKYEDLSLNLQHQKKKKGMVVYDCYPSLGGGTGTNGFWGLAGQPVTPKQKAPGSLSQRRNKVEQ